jgi:hypothetical protein
MSKKQLSVLQLWGKKRQISEVYSEKSGNGDQLNIAVATEPLTSAQESKPNAEVVADKRDEINIEVELDIGTFFERRGSVSDETKYNLLKRHFKPNKDYPFPVHVTGSKTRKFQVSWRDKYAWLVFSSVKKGVSANIVLCLLVIRPAGGLTKN